MACEAGFELESALVGVLSRFFVGLLSRDERRTRRHAVPELRWVAAIPVVRRGARGMAVVPGRLQSSQMCPIT
jgi:hypothetical protein